MKEHGRRDLVAPLACALIVGVDHLSSWGMLENPLTMVPAPTRRWAARRRGGDPVSRMARIAGATLGRHHDVTVVPALRMRALARDSVGLGGVRARAQHHGSGAVAGPAAAQRSRARRRHHHHRGDGARVGPVLQAAGVRVGAVLAVAAA